MATAIGHVAAAPSSSVCRTHHASRPPPLVRHGPFRPRSAARVIYGSRISAIGAWTVVVTGISGPSSAPSRSSSCNFIMRLMDALMAFPAILLALQLSAVLCRGFRVRTPHHRHLADHDDAHQAALVPHPVLVVRELGCRRQRGRSARGASALPSRAPERLRPAHRRRSSCSPSNPRGSRAVLCGVGPHHQRRPRRNHLAGQGTSRRHRSPFYPGLAIIVSVLGLDLLGSPGDIIDRGHGPGWRRARC